MPTKRKATGPGAADANDPKPARDRKPNRCRVCARPHPHQVGFKKGYCGYCWGELKLIQRAMAKLTAAGPDVGDRGTVRVGKLLEDIRR